jgi:LDH2 family malate/lactate/ureidoglycolate dehydrogenase
MPGELEFRTLRRRKQEGMPVDPMTLEGLTRHDERLRVEVEQFLEQ